MLDRRFYGILIAFGVFVLGFSSQTAYGEVLYGSNAETSILVAFDRDLGYIEYSSTQGTSKYTDFTLKEFRHGGFFLKSPEINPEIVIFGHPQVNDKYLLVVVTTNGFEKFTVSHLVIDIPKVAEKDVEPEIPQESDADRILREYQESVSASTRAADQELSFELGAVISRNSIVKSLDNYTTRVHVYDESQHANVQDAQITLEVSRDDKLMWVKNGNTDRTGYFRTGFELPFPEFYPTFCYEVKITIEKDGQTIYRYDDFSVYTDAEKFKPDAEHIRIYSDFNCNSEDTRTQTTTRDQPYR